MTRTLIFEAVDDGRPGSDAWTARARAAWTGLRSLVDERTWTPEGGAAAVAAFERHLPELAPVLDELGKALDRPGSAALLTGTTWKPFFAGCSQTAVAGTLVRNYDFQPEDCARIIAHTHYLRPVIGMSELLWGLLDGVNDAGLAVSLTFGGRFVHGEGMCIAMVIRYLLETCETVQEAWERLQTIPVSTAHNLTLVDHEQALSVHLGPDIPPTHAVDVCVTNHQREPVSEEQEKISRTQERLAAVRGATTAASGSQDPVEQVVEALLSPPLYAGALDPGMGGTLYTAAYRPTQGRVSYIWPRGQRWEQSFAAFEPGMRAVETG